MRAGGADTAGAGESGSVRSPGLASVVRLPIRGATAGARSVLHWSDNEVDDWGRDPDFVGRVRLVSLLRWSVTVGGEHYVPTRGPALIVVNARRFALAPIYAALALGDAVRRPVRFVGRPDIAPAGALMQRLGGLLANLDELTGVLRSGEVVVLGASSKLGDRAVGEIDHHLVGAAVATGAPVLPAATMSAPLRRGARVEIGPRIRPARRRRGPLAELELADQARAAIADLLDGLGDPGGLLR